MQDFVLILSLRCSWFSLHADIHAVFSADSGRVKVSKRLFAPFRIPMKTLAFSWGRFPRKRVEGLGDHLVSPVFAPLVGVLIQGCRAGCACSAGWSPPYVNSVFAPFSRVLVQGCKAGCACSVGFLSKGAKQAAPVRRAEARPTLTPYLRRLAVFLSGMRNTDRVCPVADLFCFRFRPSRRFLRL